MFLKKIEEFLEKNASKFDFFFLYFQGIYYHFSIAWTIF
jgi:hypothetical protein